MVATETGVSEIAIFASTMDNLNTITLDRVKVNLVGAEGLNSGKSTTARIRRSFSSSPLVTV